MSENKNVVENAKNEEELLEKLENEDFNLSDDELKQVSGGCCGKYQNDNKGWICGKIMVAKL